MASMLATALRHAARRPSPTLLVARHGARALSSRPQRRGPPQSAAEVAMNEDEKKVDVLISEKLLGYQPKLRGPAPPAPAWLNESWVPAANVSADPLENALEFRTRFYVSASGKQPEGAGKVVLKIKCRQLGLAPGELARLRSVAGDRYDRGSDELRLSSGRHEEPHKNKLELRALLGRLVADARENAAAHAATPQHLLPLADRSRIHTPTSRPGRQARRTRLAAFGPPLHRP